MDKRTASPLFGYTVAVTADRRAEEQISLFGGRGAECVHGPTVRTHPIRHEAEILKATKALLQDPPDILVAVTGIGIRGWLEAADALLLGEQLRAVLRRTRIFVRGPKAHGAVVTAGLEIEWNAPNATMSEVVAQLGEISEPGQRVAVQVDGAADQPLLDELRTLGLDVLEIPVYRWSLPDDLGPAETVIRAVAECRVDAVTFTSRPAAENFVDLTAKLDLTDEVRAAMTSHVAVCCVGSIAAAGLHDLDVTEVVIPEQFRLGAMVMTLTRELERSNISIEIGGEDVAVQGRVVTVGVGEPVMLTIRERQLLDALVEQPGLVRSKPQLLDEVWGSHELGPHVVEVTVGRLRRRLGAAGVGIETVMKRGYRVSSK